MTYYEAHPSFDPNDKRIFRLDDLGRPLMQYWSGCELVRHKSYISVCSPDGATSYTLNRMNWWDTLDGLKEASDRAYREWKTFHTLRHHRIAYMAKMEAELEILRLSLMDCPVP